MRIKGCIVTFMFILLVGCSSNSPETSTDIQEDPEDDETNKKENVEEVEDDTSTEITISTIGDILIHDEIYWGAEEDDGSYDFKPIFEDVKPYMEDSDLTIVNFETTVAGEDREYQGYPLFNTPDEIVDALKYADVDVAVTANNHMMDLGPEGLIRTAKKLDEADIDPVGTYQQAPDKRYVIKDVEGVKVALLAFAEHLNGHEDAFTDEELSEYVNMMSDDEITETIESVKEEDPDLILSYMHWGEEYREQPGGEQQHYAELMTDLGVDLIIGDHPHVLQKGEYLTSENNDHEAFVVYSLGNFISNQRIETLGGEFAHTEDGVIMNFEIEKNDEDTELKDVTYTPTWVYRHSPTDETPFEYNILPVEDFMDDSSLPSDIRERLKDSKERTDNRLELK